MRRLVLVTGARGYFGLALCHRLVESGASVVGLGHAGDENAAAAMPHEVNFYERDIAQWPLRHPPTGDLDAVVHLAAMDPPRCDADPMRAVSVNVIGTAHVRLLPAAIRARRRILASSVSVYGTRDPAWAATEWRAPPRPDTLYGATKRAAELVWCSGRQDVALRFAHIYGAGRGAHLGRRDGVTERFARAAAAGAVLDMTSPARVMDFVHVDDACEAVIAALDAPESRLRNAINIGGGAPVRVSELASLFGQEGGRVEEGASTATPGVPFGCFMDISEAARLLRWRPRTALRDGVRDLVEAMR